QSTASPNASPKATAPATETIAASPPKLTTAERQRIQAYVEKQMPNLQQALPTLAEKFSGILKKSIGGFLGVTGFLLSLILVPIYLFFLLNEKPRIQARWKEYLPLRASPLRDEVAELLSEINRYVTAYFRGQLLVCLVDGILIGTALTLLGLNFAPVIGPLLAVPLTATVKVLLGRYVWGRRLREQVGEMIEASQVVEESEVATHS